MLNNMSKNFSFNITPEEFINNSKRKKNVKIVGKYNLSDYGFYGILIVLSIKNRIVYFTFEPSKVFNNKLRLFEIENYDKETYRIISNITKGI